VPVWFVCSICCTALQYESTWRRMGMSASMISRIFWSIRETSFGSVSEVPSK
jgi:hypothetical protein